MSFAGCRIIVVGGLAESLVKFRGELLRAMVMNGHKVTVCAPVATSETQNALHEIGVSYRYIPIDRVGFNPFHDVKTLLALFSLFKEIEPDVVLSYMVKPVIYGSISARLAKIPRIYCMITGLGYAFISINLKTKLTRALVSLLYSISLRFNKKIFFQNPDDISLFLQLGILKKKEHTVLINGSGVDIEKFHPKPFPDQITFLLIARLIKDKGVYEYVEAARIIKEKYQGVSFKLVGWLDENPACIDKSDLEDWIKSGIIDYIRKLDDVRPTIAASSVYVLPSYREGTSRTVLEAMAMGRPVVTTDAPGCRETVKDGANGFLVPIKDVNALVKYMEKFILDPELIKKMGKRSREIAEEKYDVHKVNAVIMKTMELVGEDDV